MEAGDCYYSKNEDLLQSTLFSFLQQLLDFSLNNDHFFFAIVFNSSDTATGTAASSTEERRQNAEIEHLGGVRTCADISSSRRFRFTNAKIDLGNTCDDRNHRQRIYCDRSANESRVTNHHLLLSVLHDAHKLSVEIEHRTSLEVLHADHAHKIPALLTFFVADAVDLFLPEDHGVLDDAFVEHLHRRVHVSKSCARNKNDVAVFILFVLAKGKEMTEENFIWVLEVWFSCQTIEQSFVLGAKRNTLLQSFTAQFEISFLGDAETEEEEVVVELLGVLRDVIFAGFADFGDESAVLFEGVADLDLWEEGHFCLC